MLTETVFTAIFAIHVFFLVRFFKAPNYKDLVVCAIFLGVSTLCRSVSVYFFIFLGGVFFWHFRKTLRYGLLNYAILIGLFLLTISPWVARNYTVFGKMLISSQQEAAMKWNHSSVLQWTEGFKLLFSPEEVKYRPPKDSSRVNESIEIAQKPVFIGITEHLIKAISSDFTKYIRGTIGFFFTVGSSGYPRLLGFPFYHNNAKDLETPQGYNNNLIGSSPALLQKKTGFQVFIITFCLIFLTILYLSMGAGIYIGIQQKEFLKIGLLLVVIGYFFIASSGFALSERFRLPVMPYIILLSSYGMIRLRALQKNKKE